MSNAYTDEAGAIARQTKALIRAAGAALSGRERAPEAERPIHRNSFDVDDGRAQVWRPIADGTKRGALRWREKLLQVAREFDNTTRLKNRLQSGKKNSRGDLTPYGVAVLEAVLHFPYFCFKTGRLDPALTQLEKITGFARKTIVAALKRLQDHGFLKWVRRTRRKPDSEGVFGPQREQTNNAYFFDITELASEARQRLRQLLGRPQAEAPDRPSGGPGRQPRAPSAALATELARLCALVDNASNPG